MGGLNLFGFVGVGVCGEVWVGGLNPFGGGWVEGVCVCVCGGGGDKLMCYWNNKAALATNTLG